MTRKIIQVAVAGVAETIMTQCDAVFMVLCDDGTVWTATNRNEEWSQMPAIPQPAPPADPQAMPEIRVGDVVDAASDIARVEDEHEAWALNENADLVAAIYRDPLWRRYDPEGDNGVDPFDVLYARYDMGRRAASASPQAKEGQ